jgi:DNA-binding phage protein
MDISSRTLHQARLIKVATVDRHTLICDTWDVTDPVAAARAALDRAEAVVAKRRDELANAIADDVRRGEKLSRVAAKARYTREHVRRIARAHGIEDTTGREPPPPSARVRARMEAEG